jgi:hypothetical protein
MDHLLAIVVGFISGGTWEYLANKPHKAFPTLVQSRFIAVSGKTIHLHHWLWYGLMLLIIVLWALKTGRFDHPAVLLALSALMGALLYGFIYFPNWLKFIG